MRVSTIFTPRQRSCVMPDSSDKAPMMWHQLLSLGLQYCVRKTKLTAANIFVSPSIIVPRAQTAGQKEIEEAPFDAPERRKDDSVDRGAIRNSRDVSRASAKTSVGRGCR